MKNSMRVEVEWDSDDFVPEQTLFTIPSDVYTDADGECAEESFIDVINDYLHEESGGGYVLSWEEV